jgi:hypothetical protein
VSRSEEDHALRHYVRRRGAFSSVIRRLRKYRKASIIKATTFETIDSPPGYQTVMLIAELAPLTAVAIWILIVAAVSALDRQLGCSPSTLTVCSIVIRCGARKFPVL